jgi:DUF1680 family protein
LGEAIERAAAGRIGAPDIEGLVQPFRERRDKNEWRSEFWGKWLTSAAGAWRYNKDPALRAAIEQGVKALIATQSADGYIGAYPDGGHLQRWDIWGRKYTLLGLLAWHEISGDAAALAAACREADFLLKEVGPGGASPFTNDMWNGMASSSVLEPMVLLYRRTNDVRYLNFARYLVGRWPDADGPDLLNKALEGVSVAKMFPGRKPVVKTYGDAGHAKAYEMMSCYEGLAELYRSTGDARYLEAVRKVHDDIRDTEITIVGSGSDWERWCGGRRRQTEIWSKGMETCVTVTWMKLTAQVLRLTGDSRCVDEIERSAFNALLGAQSADGTWWCHHTPLAGIKERAPEQCGMAQNCCVANGPRGLVLLPALAVMNRSDGPVINLYSPLQANVPLAGGGTVHLAEETSYPVGDTVLIRVDPDAPRDFVLSLRIPEWSRDTAIEINGEAQPAPARGCFARIARRCNRGEVVMLTLYRRARRVRAPGASDFVAVTRGPLLLARDRRLGGDPDAPVNLSSDEQGYIVAEPASGAAPDRVARVFAVGDEGLKFCDFASAGNTWSDASRYRVWLPVGKTRGPAGSN